MSEAEYARYRGVARQTVHDYKRRGQLVMVDGSVDADASDALLAVDQNPVRGSSQTDTAPNATQQLFQAKLREAEARATEREIKTKALAGEYVDRTEVTTALFAVARTAQESLMAVADRLAPGLAVESDAAAIHKTLTDELRAVCQQIASDAKFES